MACKQNDRDEESDEESIENKNGKTTKLGRRVVGEEALKK